jgi:adenylate cyclase
MERRLTAILAADVVGYSRLMELDEVGTLAALKAHREELIDPAIAEHRGRIVKLMGDGTLVEFASVVDAVTCAVAIQAGMAARNNGTPEDRRIELRIGVHLGDIIVEGEDIYGEGVNIAARLEGLAEPGGVCVSAAVHDQVRNRTEYAFRDLGPQAMKNIAQPVHAFSLRDGEPAPVGAPAPPAQEKPAIAVLPFKSWSGDSDQEYFADGVAEDIITALSRNRWLTVIARNSSFTYKGEAVDLKQVGAQLDARYVLDGSVRKGGEGMARQPAASLVAKTQSVVRVSFVQPGSQELQFHQPRRGRCRRP